MPPGTSSVTGELESLAGLYEKGLITREEFEQQKRGLMGHGAAAASASAVARPTSIGAYEVLETLGEGGMGAVYRGRHRSDGIAKRQGGDVAIKMMHPQYASDATYLDRFEREATLGLKLDHPGIVKVLDLVVDGGVLALVMELVDGRPLSRMIGIETGPIPWSRALPLFKQLSEAVAHAHEHGVVHRDLKPENIVISAAGTLKVLDFGIAKELGAVESRTRTSTGMGTVDYMAPEQYTDAKHVDHRADLYALGMTLYEMLAGRLPWEPGTTEYTVLNKKARDEIPPPTTFYPDIPPHVVAALRRAMSVTPEGRFASVADFLSALQGEPVASASPQPAAQAPAPPPPPAPTPVAPVPSAARPPAPPPPAVHSTDTEMPPQGSGGRQGLVAAMLVVVCLVAVVLALQLRKDESGPASTSTNSVSPAEAQLYSGVYPVPSWILLEGSYSSKENAMSKAASLRQQGFDAGWLYFLDYASMSAKDRYGSVVGPVPYHDVATAQRLLRMLREVQPDARGLKLDHQGPRTKLQRGAEPRAPSRPAARPSFKCHKARTDVEVAICSDATLAGMDREMAGLYTSKRKALDDYGREQLRSEQRGWRQTRDRCARRIDMRICLVRQYEARVGQLRGQRQRAVSVATHVVFDTYKDAREPCLNMRSRPNSKARRLGCLSDGTKLRFEGARSGKWMSVTVVAGPFEAVSGWVHSKWLRSL